MAYDPGPERALLLSRGLFGAPSSPVERDREREDRNSEKAAAEGSRPR